jgi:hypothetical protein
MESSYRTQLPTLQAVLSFLLDAISAKAPSLEITPGSPCNGLLPIIEEIAPSIEEQFVLQRFDVAGRLSANAFHGKLEMAERIFYQRFPENCLSSSDFTLDKLAALIHLLCQIAWRTDQSRFTLSDLDRRHNGLGSQVFKLITSCGDGRTDYRQLRTTGDTINRLLGKHKIDFSDVLIDQGPFRGLPLHVSFNLASAKHEA